MEIYCYNKAANNAENSKSIKGFLNLCAEGGQRRAKRRSKNPKKKYRNSFPKKWKFAEMHSILTPMMLVILQNLLSLVITDFQI